MFHLTFTAIAQTVMYHITFLVSYNLPLRMTYWEEIYFSPRASIMFVTLLKLLHVKYIKSIVNISFRFDSGKTTCVSVCVCTCVCTGSVFYELLSICLSRIL